MRQQVHVSPPPGRASGITPSNTNQLYLPTGVTPEEAFEAIGRLRKEARDEIDRLLAFLDATDGDPDFEPGLGFTEIDPRSLAPSHPGVTDDREVDDDHEDDGAFHDSDAVEGHKLDQSEVVAGGIDGNGMRRGNADQQARALRQAKRAQARVRLAQQPRTGRARA